MNKSFTKEIVSDFISLFFPRFCLSCHGSLLKGEELICTICMYEMPQTKQHLDFDNSLKERLKYRFPVQFAMAMFKFNKSGRVQHLLHSLKYKNQPELGIHLGMIYGHQIKTCGCYEFDLILPVPLHAHRKRKRGYNQSEKFAEGLADVLGINFSDEILQRRTKTETQTRKTKLNRWENVSEVFVVSRPELIENKRILLVDDVVTTGATLESCSHAIINSACSSLSIACIAEA